METGTSNFANTEPFVNLELLRRQANLKNIPQLIFLLTKYAAEVSIYHFHLSWPFKSTFTKAYWSTQATYLYPAKLLLSENKMKCNLRPSIITCMVELSSLFSVQCTAAGNALSSSSDTGVLLLLTIVCNTSRAT